MHVPLFLFYSPEDKFSTKIRDRWLQDMFSDADKNGDGTLDLKEVLQMLRSLNVGVSKKVVKQMFKVSRHVLTGTCAYQPVFNTLLLML